MYRGFDEDFQFSDVGMKLFIRKYGMLLDIMSWQKLGGDPDWYLGQDAIITLINKTTVSASYRFRNASTKQGQDIYDKQDITFRFERPSGTGSDVSTRQDRPFKTCVDWFIYGVLSKTHTSLQRVIVVNWKKFAAYLQNHPDLLSSPIRNIDDSSTFKTVKITDIPEDCIIFLCDTARNCYRLRI